MYRILIADDEDIERKVLRRKLEKHFGESVEILEAVNGREVLNLYRDRLPEILILDIEMPGITGLEAAERVRRKDEACSIIFLTAFDEFSYARKAITVRALDYLLKPCAEKELLSAVEEGMRRADAAKERPDAAAGRGESRASEARNADAANAPERSAGGEEAGSGSGGQEREALHGGRGLSGQQETIRSFIDRNFMFDLSVQDMADELGYSEAYFCKLFKQYFGQSFVSYLTEYRISRAVKMMADASVSVKEAGRAVGYPDPNYFTKVFKRVMGQNPSEFRNSAQNYDA